MTRLQIKEFEDYLINNLGEVFSKKTGTLKKLKSGKDTKGYYHVGLSKNNRVIHKRVHRLVAEAFIANPENKPQVNHINGIKTDNRLENLEWCTHSENAYHAFGTGLVKVSKGENHFKSKLTRNEVNNILEDGRLHKEIAAEYKISASVISKIKSRKIWV